MTESGSSRFLPIASVDPRVERSERLMKQSIAHVALVVKDYDEAIEFFVTKLKFKVVEDIYQPAQDKRWVVVAPPRSK